MKSIIFTGVSFRIWAFTINGTDNSFTIRNFAIYSLKIPKRVNRVIFQNSSAASENTPADKNMFEVDNKGMFQELLFGCLYN